MTPVDDLITPDIKNTFPQTAIDTQSYNGHVYGIPTDLSLHFIYFRKDLIDKLLSDPAWQKTYGDIS